MTSSWMDWPRAIRVARARRGISQTGLAEMLKVDPTTVSRYESGERAAALPTLHEIAHLCDVPFWAFVRLAEDDKALSS